MNLQVVIDKPPTTAPMARLKELEKAIRKAEQDGLRLRWESGQQIAQLRASKPDKTLEDIAQSLGSNQVELSRRVRFAESEEHLIHAVNSGWSWHETCRNMAELTGRKRAPRRPSSVLVKEVRTFIRRMRTQLRKVHASDLTEGDLKVLDAIEEEITRIHEELGGVK